MRNIDLWCNPNLDAVAIAHLPAATWRLESLDLAQVPVTPAMAAELANLQLPELAQLHLTDTGLTAAAVSELARADWPVLKLVNLSRNDLHSAAMQHVCRLRLPLLEHLVLEHASITAEGAY